MIKVNALGADKSDSRARTGEALEALGGSGSVRVYVSDEEHASDLLDYATEKGLSASGTRPCPEHGNRCTVTIEVPEDWQGTEEEDARPHGTLAGRNAVVVISGTALGSGEDEFGRTLMQHFLYSLSRQDRVPHTFIFLNSGVRFTTEEGPELDDLRLLEEEGVQIISGDASLKHYGVQESLKVGRAANMYEITDILIEADHILKP